MSNPGQTTLATIRTTVRQRADMVNSQFVTDAELNGYINASYQELYDLLVQRYGDNYYVASPYTFTTDGVSDQFALPDGSGAPAAFYKLLGVDLQLAGGGANAYLTLKQFNFAERNRFSPPSLASVGSGTTNLLYRLNGNSLMLIPRAQAGQTIRVWYVPRLTLLVNDTDVVDGVSGWEEYVVTDAAIKCMQKEESDVSILLQQKAELVRRIESAAENRDAGSPATVSDTMPSAFGVDPYAWGAW